MGKIGMCHVLSICVEGDRELLQDSWEKSKDRIILHWTPGSFCHLIAWHEKGPRGSQQEERESQRLQIFFRIQ